MLQQAIDFKDESLALYRQIKPLSAQDYALPTLFKGWTIDDILGHLHMWNWAADLSLKDEQAIQNFLAQALAAIEQQGMKEFERDWRNGLQGPELLRTWHDFFMTMSGTFAGADPQARMKWAGPDMSVRSGITARLMETWAHGQAVYDLLGVVRADHDRIKNIAVLGINTFAWTFKNRGLPIPAAMPYVELTAPSGAIWSWGNAGNREYVRGSATAFCQTITQTRNVLDTELAVSGDTARQWMALAQCFAGPPETPPGPGVRRVQRDG